MVHESRYAKITKLKETQNLQRNGFATFDIETKDGLKGTKIFCYAIAYKDEKMHKPRAFVKQDDLTYMFKWLKHRQESNDNKAFVIWVHNLDFDVRFIHHYCLENEIPHKPILSGSKMIAYLLTDLNVRFQDSVQFLLAPQEKAEIQYHVNPNLRKIDCSDLFEIPYSLWSNKDKCRVIDHNRNDVLALWDIMNKFRKFVFEIYNINLLDVFTPASLAMKGFRKTLTEDLINPFILFTKSNKTATGISYKVDYEKDNFVRNSYFGGRCEVFDFRPHKNQYYVDVVSLYPSQMYNHYYPLGIPFWSNNHDEILDCFMGGMLGFAKIEFTPSNLYYPILPTRIDERICFTNVPNQIGTYSSAEILYAIKLGYKVKCIKALIFPKKDKIFKYYISKLFEEKSKSKGGRRDGAKLGMNGLYGKFGQNPIRKDFQYAFHNTKSEGLDYMDNHKKSIMKYSKTYEKWYCIHVEEIEVIRPFMNIAFASFTTSYARIVLHKQMHHLYTKHNILSKYCDTDSVVINSTDYPFCINKGKQLGNWDIEAKFRYFQAKAPKSYIKEEKINDDWVWKIKLKGVPKYKIEEILQQSKGNVKEMNRLLHEPIQMAERYAKFRESMRYGIALTTKKLAKHYSFNYQKREVLKDKTTKPITQI